MAFAVDPGAIAADGLAEAIAQEGRQHQVHGVVAVIDPAVAAPDHAFPITEDLAQEALVEFGAPG